MDLLITAEQQSISWNYDEVKAYVVDAVSKYEGLVIKDDQIAFAKEKRAELNKLSKALDDARKAQKKKAMQPFTVFEGEIKEVTAIIANASRAIDVQVKDYEERKRKEKLAAIEAEFAQHELPAKWLNLNRIMQPNWLNATFSMNKVKTAIIESIEKVKDDLAVIRQLPEYAFEAEEHYSKHMDLAAAMREVKRLAEQAQRKAAVEAEIAAAREREKSRQELQRNQSRQS